MRRSFEDYKILVRSNENEDFEEIDYIEHSIEHFITPDKTHITHTILYVDKNGMLDMEEFENEDVRFVFVDKIQPIINTTVNNTLSEEMVDNLTNIAMAMSRRGLE